MTLKIGHPNFYFFTSGQICVELKFWTILEIAFRIFCHINNFVVTIVFVTSRKAIWNWTKPIFSCFFLNFINKFQVTRFIRAFHKSIKSKNNPWRMVNWYIIAWNKAIKPIWVKMLIKSLPVNNRFWGGIFEIFCSAWVNDIVMTNASTTTKSR